MDLRNGDCLELMKTLPDKSVDLFLCDLPYGETNCKWDTKIDMVEFWKEFKRIRKSPKVACIHFCSTKFGYTLIKSWEKGYKMDLVWKKRNKTGGLQSRYRPMRNHEMMYFFYDQAPKYNRDKYHKRIQSQVGEVTYDKNKYKEGDKGRKKGQGLYRINVPHKKNNYEPPNPASIVEEEKCLYGFNKKDKQEYKVKDLGKNHNFEPPNPASVVEEEEIQKKQGRKMYKDTTLGNLYLKKEVGAVFEPPNPASVVEEETTYGISKEKCIESRKCKFAGLMYEPPNPASVVEENADSNKVWGYNKPDTFKISENGTRQNFEPPNPASVVEEHDYCFGDAEYIKAKGNTQGTNNFEPPNPSSVVEDTDIYGETKEQRQKRRECDCNFEPPNPASVVESSKVFIGKRNHQTEKPQDVLEFLLKYWTDEDNVVLDPTMGSGSTGVACKKLNRKFIGFELDPKIYDVAVKRINKN